jgi:hypothetical protein
MSLAFNILRRCKLSLHASVKENTDGVHIRSGSPSKKSVCISWWGLWLCGDLSLLSSADDMSLPGWACKTDCCVDLLSASCIPGFPWCTGLGWGRTSLEQVKDTSEGEEGQVQKTRLNLHRQVQQSSAHLLAGVEPSINS